MLESIRWNFRAQVGAVNRVVGPRYVSKNGKQPDLNLFASLAAVHRHKSRSEISGGRVRIRSRRWRGRGRVDARYLSIYPPLCIYPYTHGSFEGHK